MADRQKSLRRLVAVQGQMVRLNEWRLAQAEQSCRMIEESQTRLQTYVVEEGALGATLARAALRSLHGLDKLLAEAERQRAASQKALEGAKQRAKTAEKVSDRVGREARRSAEDRELARVVETWLAAKGTSLP
jgi:hypothetical protein